MTKFPRLGVTWTKKDGLTRNASYTRLISIVFYTWSVEFGHNPDPSYPGVLNDVSDVLLAVHVSVGAVGAFRTVSEDGEIMYWK